MALFSSTEYVILAFSSKGVWRGCRLRRQRAGLLLTQVEEISGEGSFSEKLEKIYTQLEVGREDIFIISGSPDGAMFFECTMPAMSNREMRSALEFEAQEHVILLPSDLKIQFVVKESINDKLRVNAGVFPGAILNDIVMVFSKNRWRIDEFIHPLLSLPKISKQEKVKLPELDEAFYWQAGEFRPVSTREQDYNVELIKYVTSKITIDPKLANSKTQLYEDYLTPLLIGIFADQKETRQSRDSLSILPGYIKPQRHRNQLRLTVALGVVLLLLFVISGVQHISAFTREYNQVVRNTGNLLRKTSEQQTTLKAKSRELKEMKRVVEANRGEHEIIEQIALISKTLPTNALVTSMRFNETGIDLILQIGEPNYDISGTLRRLVGYSLNNVQQRNLSDTISSVTLKLTKINGGAQ